MLCSIEEIIADFPDTRIAFIVAKNLVVFETRPLALEQAIEEGEAYIRTGYSGRELASIPEIQDWRRAYKGFGVKKTSYRSSVERLLKNTLADRPLPQINALVDSYNLISLRYLVPIGADDLDKVEACISFRRAREGDEFYPLAGNGSKNDPPKEGEIVYADEKKILCRRWNWQQDRRSAVTLSSNAVVLTVQAQAAADLESAAKALCDTLTRFCEAETKMAITSREHPSVDLAL